MLPRIRRSGGNRKQTRRCWRCVHTVMSSAPCARVACLNRVCHAAGRRLLSQSQLELKQQQKLLAELHQAEGHARGEYDSIKSTLEALGQTKAELEKSVSSLAEQRQQLTRLVKAEQEKVAHATRVRGGVAAWSPAPALADQCAACVPCAWAYGHRMPLPRRPRLARTCLRRLKPERKRRRHTSRHSPS